METSPTPFTSRAVLLSGVLVVIVVLIAVPLRAYIMQRGQIAALQAQKVASEKNIETLTARIKSAKDPDVVRQQARDRLHYVMPGEVAYIVLDSTAQDATTNAPVRAPDGQQVPWYSALWQSVQRADAN